MDWIKIKNSDLECVLNKTQLALLKSSYLTNAGHDVVSDIIASVVARIRAEIAASGINMLDCDHSKIPYELKECALNLALESLQARLPDLKMPEVISKKADEARAILIRIAEGKLPMSKPLYSIKGAQPRGVYFGKSSQTINSKSLNGL